MGHRTVNVEIAAAPATVFGIYTDAARLGDWQSGACSDRMVGGEIVGRFSKDSAKLTALAERQPGPG